MFRTAVLVLALSSCVSASLKSSGSHIDTANAALARGDYAAAENAYKEARARSEGNQWVIAEAERGEAQIALARLRESLPARRTDTREPQFVANSINDDRKRLRADLGGNAEVDAELVVLLGTYAERAIAAAEARAAGGELHAAASFVAPLLAIPDVPAAVRDRALALRAKAVASSQARAAAAGDARPLARQLHLALAASFTGGGVPDPKTLLAPYQRGVQVDVTAPANCALARLPADLAQPGTTRRATVTVKVTTCTAKEATSTGTETAKWTEDVPDGHDTVMVPQERCENVCGSVLSGGEECQTNYNTNPPSLLCTKNTITKCANVCQMVDVPTQKPRYRKEPRSAQRTTTTQTSEALVEGTWVVHRDGHEVTGTIGERPTSKRVSAPAVGGAPASSEGGFTSPSGLLDAARRSVAAKLQSALDSAFALDVQRAEAAGRAAAASIDDEEDAWLRAIAFGGKDLGPIASRYGIDRDRALQLLQQASFTASAAATPGQLPETKVFATVERSDTNNVTGNDLDGLAKSVPPLFGGQHWIQLDGEYRSLIIADDPSGMAMARDSGYLLGVRAGTGVLDRKKAVWGWRVADEFSMGIALGARTGGPEAPDDPLADYAGVASLHYSLGAGYRKPGLGALFAGVRGTAEVFLVGTSSGSYTTLPLFARGEVALTFGTVAAEVLGVALAGASQYGLSLQLSTTRKRDRLKYFQLRIERTSVAPSSQDLNTPGGTSSIGLHDMTAVHLMYGIGR